MAVWSDPDGEPKRMKRRGTSSITSTRPNADRWSNTTRGPAVVQDRAAAASTAGSAPRQRRFSTLVKASFLILDCWRVTTTALRVPIGCLELLLGVLFTTT